MPTNGGGQRRLLFTGNVKTNLVNKYTAGTGVGAISTSARRALKRRATSSTGSLDAKGNLIHGKPCCPIELERKPIAIAHLHKLDEINLSFFLKPPIDCMGTPPNGSCWENGDCKDSFFPQCS